MKSYYKIRPFLGCLLIIISLYVSIKILPWTSANFAQAIELLRLNKYANEEDKLAKAITHLENRLQLAKKRHLEMNTSSLFFAINERLKPGIKFKSIRIYRGKYLSIEGESLSLESLTSFAKDLEFSQGVFTGLNISFTYYNEQSPYYFTIKGNYNPPYGQISELKETSNFKESSLKVTIDEYPKWLKTAYQEEQSIEEFLPSSKKESQVLEICQKLAIDNNLLFIPIEPNFEHSGYQIFEQGCKGFNLNLRLTGSYADLNKFFTTVAASDRIIKVPDIKLTFLGQEGKLVEAEVTVSSYYASEEDLVFEQPLINIPSIGFEEEKSYINDGIKYYYTLTAYYSNNKHRSKVRFDKVNIIEDPKQSTKYQYSPLFLTTLKETELVECYPQKYKKAVENVVEEEPYEEIIEESVEEVVEEPVEEPVEEDTEDKYLFSYNYRPAKHNPFSTLNNDVQQLPK